MDPWNFVSVLISDAFAADDPVTWWGSLQPVFQQYANLYPVMDVFLDMADYESVCENAELLRLAFGLDEANPDAMPVTRDLSRAKREAILRWLDAPGPDGKPLLGTPPAQGAGAGAGLDELAPAPPRPLVDAGLAQGGGKAAAAARRRAIPGRARA